MKGAHYRAAGGPVITRHGSTAFVVHPFLFDAPSRRVRLDWENVEYRWIAPGELKGLDTVPRLDIVLERILHTQ